MSKKLTSLIYILISGFMIQIGFASTPTWGPLEKRCRDEASNKKAELKRRNVQDPRTALSNIEHDENKCLNAQNVQAEVKATRKAAAERRAQEEEAARVTVERNAAAAREATAAKESAAGERRDNCIQNCNRVVDGKPVQPDAKQRAACVSNCR